METQIIQISEGNQTQQAVLLANTSNHCRVYSEPNFEPPYPIDQGADFTRIIVHKRQCCNKIVTSVVTCTLLLAFYSGFAIWMALSDGFADGGYIAVIIFGLMAIMLIFVLLKSISILCQYQQTELHINRMNNVIEVYEPKMRYLYGSQGANSVNYSGICGCDFKPKITTICYISDFEEVVFDQSEGRVYLKFVDMYNRKTNYYFIQQSGKYNDFAGVQHLDYMIRKSISSFN